MITDYFSIHNLLTLKTVREHNHPLDGYLFDTLSQYHCAPVESPDLVIVIHRPGGRRSPPDGAITLDDRWCISADSISTQEFHKGARWSVSIEGLDAAAAPCTITIATNSLGRMVFPADHVFPLIRLRMNLSGTADIHGASVCKDGSGFLFAGRSGTGKTVTAINFIREGYGLLADDESWLRDGRVFSYRGPLNIRYTYNPETALGLRLSPRQKLAVWSKKLLSFVTLGAVTLFTNFKPEEFGVDCAASATLKKAYLCIPGDRFSIDHDINPGHFLSQLIQNNRFEMSLMEGIRLAYLCARPRSLLSDYWEIHCRNLQSGLKGAQCNRLVIPRYYTRSIFKQIRADVEK